MSTKQETVQLATHKALAVGKSEDQPHTVRYIDGSGANQTRVFGNRGAMVQFFAAASTMEILSVT
jgi:hypothetical protein